MKVYVPDPGNDWNPLRAWPRNNPCVCGSNKKFKHCHLKALKAVVTVEEAIKLKAWIKQYGFKPFPITRKPEGVAPSPANDQKTQPVESGDLKPNQ